MDSYVDEGKAHDEAQNVQFTGNGNCGLPRSGIFVACKEARIDVARQVPETRRCCSLPVPAKRLSERSPRGKRGGCMPRLGVVPGLQVHAVMTMQTLVRVWGKPLRPTKMVPRGRLFCQPDHFSPYCFPHPRHARGIHVLFEDSNSHDHLPVLSIPLNVPFRGLLRRLNALSDGWRCRPRHRVRPGARCTRREEAKEEPQPRAQDSEWMVRWHHRRPCASRGDSLGYPADMACVSQPDL